jgi:hypothetical protein
MCNLPDISLSDLGIADGTTTLTVTGCSTLSTSDFYERLMGGGPGFSRSCSSPLPCTGSRGIRSVSDLQSALSDPELQAELASAQDFTGPGYWSLRAGHDSWLIGDCDRLKNLDPATACKPASKRLLALIDLLQGLAQQNSCTPM